MSDSESKVHPFRRKHRRGRRGRGKKAKLAQQPLTIAPPEPSTILSLRKRLSQLSQVPHARAS